MKARIAIDDTRWAILQSSHFNLQPGETFLTLLPLTHRWPKFGMLKRVFICSLLHPFDFNGT
jgi:hypothetical protein